MIHSYIGRTREGLGSPDYSIHRADVVMIYLVLVYVVLACTVMAPLLVAPTKTEWPIQFWR